MSDAGPFVPAAWRTLALAPPRASGEPRGVARIKVEPGDFRVEERLGFDADGGSAHLLLRVEKTDANTLFVARRLARAAGLRPQDVGFAGLKDRRAVAIQWFSVPAGRPPRDLAGFEGPGFRVLDVLPHSRKLRRGALAGNRFRIVLRDVAGERQELERRLSRVAAHGAPNYFGPQRFGRDGANLESVAAWTGGGALPVERESRAFVLSAARALTFNALLAARVEAGSWDRLLPGEVVSLDGTASVFVAEEIDSGLEARCATGDVHPSGPLPGRGGLQPALEAGVVEAAALAPFAALVAALCEAGVEAARRPLRVLPRALEHHWLDGALAVSFELPRGAFATAVLAEVAGLDLQEAESG